MDFGELMFTSAPPVALFMNVICFIIGSVGSPFCKFIAFDEPIRHTWRKNMVLKPIKINLLGPILEIHYKLNNKEIYIPTSTE